VSISIAVWGASGSGKTCLAVKLAQAMIERDTSVLLLLADRVTPPLPCIAPPHIFTNKRSLGSVLAAPHPSSALLRFHLIGVEDMPLLHMLGFLKGENALDYPQPQPEQSRTLLEVAATLVDIVISDCGTALPWDALSLTAIRQADYSLCLMNPNLKTVSYLSSQLALTTEGQKESQQSWRLLNHAGDNDRVADVFASTDYELPFCPELAEQAAEGELLQPLSKKASRRYLQIVEQLTEDILYNKTKRGVDYET
jgi:hypothetical protein